jgi:hypothetical protein
VWQTPANLVLPEACICLFFASGGNTPEIGFHAQFIGFFVAMCPPQY